jgi:hypothetical protein
MYERQEDGMAAGRRSQVREARLASRSYREAALRGDPNPIVRRTTLRRYDWEVRQYADGTFDARALHGLGVTTGELTFDAVVERVRQQERAA